MERNPYAPPSSNIEVAPAGSVAPAVSACAEPAGLSGWLVLVGFGLVGAPIRLTYFVLQTFLPIFRDGTWQALTTPVSQSYHPFWAPLLVVEIVINVAFIAASIYLLFLFFRRSWRFPRLYIAFVIANLTFILADSFALRIVLPQEPVMDPATMREFGRLFFFSLIWIPYMVFSKRVKNTFVQIDA